MAVPSLVTICLDFLAENAGYIVDLDGVPCEAVLEICKRAPPSGLINLEIVLADAIRSGDIATSPLWTSLLQAKQHDSNFIISRVPISQCSDYARQVYTASLLRLQAAQPFLEAEDSALLIENCGHFLTFAELHANPAMWLQPVCETWGNIRHLDISEAKIGPAGAEYIKTLLTRSRWLQSLDISRNRLELQGAALVAEGLAASTSLVQLNVAFNGLNYAGVKVIVDALQRNVSVLDLDATRNLYRGDVVKGASLIKQATSYRTISIRLI
jgi:hypothetical protein